MWWLGGIWSSANFRGELALKQASPVRPILSIVGHGIPYKRREICLSVRLHEVLLDGTATKALRGG